MKKDKLTNVERNVLMLLQNKTADYEDKIALGMKSPYGWKEFTYKGVGLLARKLANYMIHTLNIQKDEKVAILSESKPEFGPCVFATILCGATFVPLDVKLTKFELLSILSDCEPVLLFVSQTHFQMALELKEELSFIKHIIVIDDMPDSSAYTTLNNIENNYEGKFRRSSLKSTVFLIYTSGTTGAPKGVEISYLNMITQLKSLAKVRPHFFPKKDENIIVLSILPMNHLFELTVGFSTFMHWGLSIYYTQSLRPKDILGIMREKNVKFMIVVPAFLKLLKTGIENKIKNSPPFERAVFNIMYKIAKFIPSTTIKKIIFSKIHDQFGGSFGGCISGGAPLDTSVGEFFERIGIKVFHGYGLTETSPVVCVNFDKRSNLHSVGRPFETFETKIDKKTGEILFRGNCVMKGYYKRPDLTAEAVDKDGWLHTGDIGRLDKSGHLYITGRIKNMIVLSGGKKVFPEEVESVFEKSDKFKEVCVFGTSKCGGNKGGTEEIAAIIVPDDSIISEPNVEEIVKKEIKFLSLRLAPYKRPVNVIISKEPLPRTTTRKIKRQAVKELVKT